LLRGEYKKNFYFWRKPDLTLILPLVREEDKKEFLFLGECKERLLFLAIGG
jgi:hypothetical protein